MSASRFWSAALAAGVLLLLTTGCSTNASPVAEEPDAGAPAVESEAAGEGWVVVKFESRDERFDLDLMDKMLATELAADEALAAAEAGAIDGNDVGDGEYALYFTGGDAERMWEVLEPIFADAPVPWTTVVLKSGFDDSEPRVLTQ